MKNLESGGRQSRGSLQGATHFVASLGGRDVLIVRADRKDAFVILRLSLAAQIAVAATRAAEIQSPESIGKDFAAKMWNAYGRNLVIHAATYKNATAILAKICSDPAARSAFDKRLAQLAFDAHGIVRPKLPKDRVLERQAFKRAAARVAARNRAAAND